VRRRIWGWVLFQLAVIAAGIRFGVWLFDAVTT